jgi:tetratricopeptide (TPR) repeat protein
LTWEPRWAAVLNNLGNAELELGRYDESVLAFEQAQASAPTDADIASNLGNALRVQGRHEASLLACRRALELDPNLSAAHNNLSRSRSLGAATRRSRPIGVPCR